MDHGDCYVYLSVRLLLRSLNVLCLPLRLAYLFMKVGTLWYLARLDCFVGQDTQISCFVPSESKMLSEAIPTMFSTIMLCGALGVLSVVLGTALTRDQKRVSANVP